MTVAVESWPIAGRFRIARGAKTEALVVVVTLERDGRRGRGEAVPYGRYGETADGVVAAIDQALARLGSVPDRAALQQILPPGAARNAIDCALWDLEAKLAGRPAHVLAGLPPPVAAMTAYTLSLDDPAAMGLAARQAADRPLLKLKLGGDGQDLQRVAAVRDGAPAARLIVDANESWSPATVERLCHDMARHDVALIEQPVAAGDEACLTSIRSPVPLCADESCHDRHGLAALAEAYQCINVKLDKTGGLTEAIALVDAARHLGLGIMIGCMVGTSLAMAPAALLAGAARFVDLDGPLLLARDRTPGITYHGSLMLPPPRALWG